MTLLSMLAVAMNPGSNVKTFRSLVKWEMLITSGPMVPDIDSSSADLPVARFFSSYFVLMPFSDGIVRSIWNFAALHGRTGESRACGQRAGGGRGRFLSGKAGAESAPHLAPSAHAQQKRRKNQAFAAAVAYF